MYLKKIEIYGFKSFGNKVEINFENDVIGIVGPNGSGKSNIVDAVRWVLGEQRVKSLRGSKMEDVIFSGTEEKRALGYAFVNITLDNTDQILPIDYSEVNISRRLYRSGESEYYINKNSVRLKDVQELFMDTGISKGGYSIIGQGQIESIVNNSAVERKLMIEEAVGIVKYKTRKNEAIKKLDKTDNNLVRILDIALELEKRLPSLKRNSKKAHKYLNLRDELKSIELNLFLHEMDRHNDDIKKYIEDKEILQKDLNKMNISIEELDKKYQHLKEETASFDELINNANSKIHDLINNYENSKIEIQVNESKIENHNANINSINETIDEQESSINSKLKLLEEIQDNLEIEIKKEEQLNKEYEKYKLYSKEIKEKSENTSKTIDEINKQIEEKENKLFEKRKKLNFNINKEKNNDFIIEKLSEEIEILNTKLKESKDTQKNINLLENSKEEDLKKVTYEKEICIKEYEDYKREVLNKYNDIKLLENERDLLLGYEENREGYKFAIRKLFEHSKNDTSFKDEIYGTLGDIINAKDKYLEAINRSLASNIEHVVVKNEKTATRAIELLKKNKWGRITFLPHNIIKGNSLNNIDSNITSSRGYIGIAADLVEYEPRFKDIVYSFLGRVLVFSNIDDANKFAKKSGYKYKITTLDGEVLFPGGALVGGKGSGKKEDLFSRKNKINNLKKAIKKAKSSYEELLEKREEFKDKIGVLTKEEDLLTKEVNQITLENEKLLNQITLEENKQSDLIKSIKTDEEKISELSKSKDFVTNENENLNKEIEKSTNEVNKLKESLSDVTLGKHKDEYLEVSTVLNKKEIECYKQSQIVKSLNDDIEQINKDINSLKENKENLLKQIEENKRQIDELTRRKQQASNLDNNYDILKENLNEEYLKLVEKKKEKAEEYDKTNKELLSLNEEKYKLIENIRTIEGKKEKTDITMDYLSRGILEDYNLTYNEAYEYRKDIENLTVARQNVKELKEKIKKLGNINIDSIEEYKEVSERYEFLTKQKDDLTNSKDELLKIITDMNSKIEEKFLLEFNKIQIEFNNCFNKLFSGGKAKLILTDADNIMESGIDIVASPPKTKLKNISSLSGGEKSMTAIALIFAILKIKPSPFCILDEIDAALDDANLKRFCEFLNSIKMNNQFIIITHRKITMAIADILYGVSMDNSGITKLVSVKLNQVDERGVINE